MKRAMSLLESSLFSIVWIIVTTAHVWKNCVSLIAETRSLLSIFSCFEKSLCGQRTLLRAIHVLLGKLDYRSQISVYVVLWTIRYTEFVAFLPRWIAILSLSFILGAEADAFENRCLVWADILIEFKLLLQAPLHVYLPDEVVGFKSVLDTVSRFWGLFSVLKLFQFIVFQDFRTKIHCVQSTSWHLDPRQTILETKLLQILARLLLIRRNEDNSWNCRFLLFLALHKFDSLALDPNVIRWYRRDSIPLVYFALA